MANPKITTPGALVLKHSMPTQAAKDHFDIYRPLDKGGVKALVSMLMEHGGEEAPEHINNLGKIFFNKATEIGASTPLSDYINDSHERDAIIDEFNTKVQRILHSNKSRSDKNKELGDLASDYNGRIAKQNLDYLVSKGSVAAKMAKTGARGNPNQLASGTASPLMSLNVKGELIPVVIKRSFAEGMSPAEHIALSYMGRASTVLSQLSTALPGALFKRLGSATFHEVVTVDDCGTHNGIQLPIDDKKALLGRFEAGTNHLVDEAYLKDMKVSGKKVVKVRSTMTCEAHDGVCCKCFGLMATGKLPEIGTNVGVIAAQSVSEVLTQSMLSTKHKASVGERKGNIFEQASNLLNNPADNFKDKATISTRNGTVTDVRKTPLGDHHVFIDGHMHFIPIAQEVTVKPGDKVKAGSKLSTGTVNPRELVALRGLGDGRDYMSNELRGIYPKHLDPRHFEIISRNLMRYVEVDKPGDTGLLPGDKMPIGRIRKYLEKGMKEMPVERAEGAVLAKGASTLTPGTLLDGNHISELKDAGVKTVHLTGSGLTVKPLVPGLQSIKLLDPDWVSRLGVAKLRDSLKESAALGLESDIHSTDPIAAYTFGTEFGEGENGKY
jgi:DNA-directed RNA polymerase subunit beta'